MGSDLPERYCSRRLGRSTSKTLLPSARKKQAGKSGTEGAGAFYPDALQGTESVRPLRELFVAARCRRDAQGAEASAESIQCNGDVEVLVGIHTQSDSLGICRDASHVFPPLGRRVNLARAMPSPEPRRGGHHCDGPSLPKSASFYKVPPISVRWWLLAPGPADESPARHSSCRPVKIWVRQ